MGKRKHHLDLLRIISIFAVIVLHAAGRCVRYGTPDQLDGQICQAFVSMFSWAVPVFVMISGALFLAPEKEVTLKSIYSKYILRLSVAYLFWSCIYTILFSTLRYYDFFTYYGVMNTITGTLRGGSAHLWFMWMILGLYMLIPVIRACLKNISDTVLIYWLIIGFVFCSIVPLFRNFGLFESIFGADMDTIHRSMFGEYIFYFILGYALEHRFAIHKYRKLLYCVGVVSIVITVLVTALQSFVATDYFLLANHSPTMVFSSIALYVYCKSKNENNTQKTSKYQWLLFLTPYVFGIYLVHNLFLDSIGIAIIERFVQSLPLTLLMLILIIFTCIVSFIVVWLIRRIKPIAKYIT